MSSPNDEGDAELREAVSKNEVRAEWGGAAVVFGLIVEVVLTAAYRHGQSIIESWGPVFADALIALGVAAEILFARKARSRAETLQHRSDEKIAELNRQATEANAIAATANVRLEHFRLEEYRRRQPRRINDDKKEGFIAEIKGKFPAITLIFTFDAEVRAFALSITAALSEAGIEIHALLPTPNPSLPKAIADILIPLETGNAGVLMYAPGFTGDGSQLDDPLRKALIVADIFGGEFVAPIILGGVDPNEYAIYVTPKPPW